MTEAFITRRGLVQAGAAALGAVSVPVATATVANALLAPASLEAALVTLIDRHGTAIAEWNTLGEFWDDLHAHWQQEKPPRPAALNARLFEGIGASPIRGRRSDSSTGLIYGDIEVKQIRAATPRPRCLGSDELCPRAVARRAEILTAYDAWQAECDAVSDRIGLPSAEAKATAAAEVVESVEMDILGYQPRTLAGFVIKARWIAAQNSADDWAEQVVRDLCSLGEGA